MRKLQIVIAFGLLSTVALACGTSAPPQPALAEDPTASASARSTQIGTCRWVPALPADREDPCTFQNKGATLEVTEREDMRPESASTAAHTCTCD